MSVFNCTSSSSYGKRLTLILIIVARTDQEHNGYKSERFI